MSVRRARGRAPQIFAVPTTLATITAVGLVAALIGDGAWDALGWAALAFPILIAGRYCLAEGRSSKGD